MTNNVLLNNDFFERATHTFFNIEEKNSQYMKFSPRKIKNTDFVPT